ncbi:MAG: lasso peptide biosynthesis B2 protein [Desulfomonile tiedjei]|uniref:Lasso peptide biosynthesis B2 protein n=1 Tax=Desulfomonile tiedjei TaxID=2358 RepID=A0A9D6V0V6_9BACT|nr:lasso peptide biosynthesis B2 protein [Desulfomonile tiedjei]
MRALRKLLALSGYDRILIVSTAAALSGIWIGLRLFPFGKVLETVDRLSTRVSPRKSGSRWGPDRIVWAVLAVSRYSPLSFSCLVQALAAKITLSRQGYPVIVRIGVAPTDGGPLRAHAWLEYNGRIVIGDKCREGFRPLPCFDRGQY